MEETNIANDAVERVEETLTAQRIEAFRAATRTKSTKGLPATLATRFRANEFAIVSGMGVDLHALLHAEQSYEFFSPFQVNDVPNTKTIVKSKRERKTMMFLVLETEVTCQGQLRAKCLTTFVVRQSGGKLA